MTQVQSPRSGHLRALPLIAVCMLLATWSQAWADPINPGFDYLTTPPSSVSLMTPFGPVLLSGHGIGGTSIDTIVQRHSGLPSGGTGVIDAEIVALSLISVTPVEITGSFFDVFVTINKGGLWPGILQPDPLPASIGQITITSHVDSPAPGGGTFDSFFDVFADLVFVEVGGPSNILSTPLPPDQLRSFGSSWTHGGTTEAMGGFRPDGPIVHSGPHPQTNPGDPPFPRPIPEPASLLLFGSALLGAAWRRRRAA